MKRKNSKENKSFMREGFNITANGSGQYEPDAFYTEQKEIEDIEKRLTSILYFQRKQKSNLLGSFVSNKYEISDQIVLESLLRIPKRFETQEGQTIYASSKLDEFVLNFKIEIDISYSFCSARLSIIEIEDLAEENIKHTTELDRVVEDYSKDFKDRVFEKWNIYFTDNQIAKDDFLLSLLRMQKEEFLFNKELISILSQLYLLRMLKLLDDLGEFGEKLKQEYILLMEGRLQKDPSISLDFVFQKELLDYIFRKNKAFPIILKNAEGRQIIDAYLKPLENLRDKNFESLTESVKPKTEKKEEKKEAKKASESVLKWGSTLSRPVTKPAPKIDYKALFGKSNPVVQDPDLRVVPPTNGPQREQPLPQPQRPMRETPEPPRDMPITPSNNGNAVTSEEEMELEALADLLGKEISETRMENENVDNSLDNGVETGLSNEFDNTNNKIDHVDENELSNELANINRELEEYDSKNIYTDEDNVKSNIFETRSFEK